MYVSPMIRTRDLKRVEEWRTSEEKYNRQSSIINTGDDKQRSYP